MRKRQRPALHLDLDRNAAHDTSGETPRGSFSCCPLGAAPHKITRHWCVTTVTASAAASHTPRMAPTASAWETCRSSFAQLSSTEAPRSPRVSESCNTSAFSTRFLLFSHTTCFSTVPLSIIAHMREGSHSLHLYHRRVLQNLKILPMHKTIMSSIIS